MFYNRAACWYNVSMVKVKICGITRPDDALRASHLGADALGFNFVSGSPRCITPQRALEIRNMIPPFVFTVGVFANEDTAEVERIASYCRLHYVQLHGDESPDACSRVRNAGVIKAFRVACASDLQQMEGYRVSAFLLDAKVEGMLGGTGRRIEPALAREAAGYGPVILAGGLTPANVAEAIEAACPYAVDVAGGVEEAPGVKSGELVAEFIRNARGANLT